jgi:hypothetical protein
MIMFVTFVTQTCRPAARSSRVNRGIVNNLWPESLASQTGPNPRRRLPSPDSRLHLASGVDLTSSVSNVVSALKAKVPDVESTTHVFFTAYIAADDFQAAKQINTSILDIAMRAVEQLAPNLETVILQTGGKGYGVEFDSKYKLHSRGANPVVMEYQRTNSG